MIRALFAAVALLAAACAPMPAGDLASDLDSGPQVVGVDGKPLVTPEGVIDGSVQEQLTADPAACAKAGGEIRPVCMLGKPMCVVAFDDAGKTCSDGSECKSGRCYTKDMGVQPEKAVTGVCATTNNPCGCRQSVEKGKAGYPLCVD